MTDRGPKVASVSLPVIRLKEQGKQEYMYLDVVQHIYQKVWPRHCVTLQTGKGSQRADADNEIA